MDIMILWPVRCYTCNKVLAGQDTYDGLLAQGISRADALDRLGFSRYCCRRAILAPIQIPFGPESKPFGSISEGKEEQRGELDRLQRQFDEMAIQPPQNLPTGGALLALQGQGGLSAISPGLPRTQPGLFGTTLIQPPASTPAPLTFAPQLVPLPTQPALAPQLTPLPTQPAATLLPMGGGPPILAFPSTLPPTGNLPLTVLSSTITLPPTARLPALGSLTGGVILSSVGPGPISGTGTGQHLSPPPVGPAGTLDITTVGGIPTETLISSPDELIPKLPQTLLTPLPPAPQVIKESTRPEQGRIEGVIRPTTVSGIARIYRAV